MNRNNEPQDRSALPVPVSDENDNENIDGTIIPSDAGKAIETFEPIQKILDESLQYNTSPNRGELWLFPSEADVILSYLASKNLNEIWTFQQVDDTSIVRPLSKNGTKTSTKKKKKTKKSKAPLTDIKHSKPAETAGRNKYYNDTKSERILFSTKSELPPPTTHRLSRLSQSQLKKLPDWAQRLHRTLSWLCQTEIYQPFLHEMNSTDSRFTEMYNAIQPGLTPIGLATIVSKLEQNAYQTSLDAFNDIYSVWLCGYRTHPPGSPLWIQTFQASRTFTQQIANQPLKDNFTPEKFTNALPSYEKNPSFKYENVQESVLNEADSNGSATVDQILHEFLALCDTTDKTKSGVAPNKNIHHQPLDSSCDSQSMDTHLYKKHMKKKYKSETLESISDFERTNFQNHLSQLEATHHRKLFEAFRCTAVWRSIETGEVELDDAKTSPPVFRKMIAWCHAQLSNKVAMNS
ncbi:uncharacterized protein LOC128882522 [Hylaeus volcanicus]|uniref:uncharacterized protein LOC128882522 n=1 Tax=Hylaeus volcanicus TaxID=313075 RepID=UPI0023B80AF1|nr:uncharacterized protein LOC128882522 [Hylaeus volcanicus]XP_053990108.1 uncharacterized protein LOC128882522 [Hylaeus volcanicus]XP_053990109.1 uncharacterized protein LOC128882522 [Hylaeus volcanicus]XP_053990110.1 uncharacterized protein LOC128882522 [Hylaeus volcanicus]XP_053990111.1 uncharacterized protein LOC128882522 [Hylaeus volcanicus]